jgi:tRNA-2-methylthio-N6-dimethylallyladenosine synthase
MKLFTKTFGCQMNFADSDEMTRHFRVRGYQSTDDEAASDAILVNTCTVRDLAEHKAVSFIGRLRDWKLANPDRLIVVTGCAAERAKAEMKQRFPYIDLIVGAKDIDAFPAELDLLLSRNQISEESLVPTDLPLATPGGVVQYVNIMRGCNYSCTYCIVPSVRGREIYRPIADILADTAARVNEGAKEIWLLGQTVNSYKPSVAPFAGYDFADLLRDVAKVPGLERLRFISPHPHYLTPKLIAAMKETPQVCDHIHLPVQSGSNALLQRMRRNYTREMYLDGVRKLRKAIPSISITTDIIVGFPTETEDDYQATLSLVEEADFDSAYCFQYSPRPGTAAAAMPDDVPDTIKEERVNRLLALTDGNGTRKAQSFIGSEQTVLIEDDKGDGVFRGKTRNAWRMRIKNPNLKIGDLVRVRVSSTHSRELHGDVI